MAGSTPVDALPFDGFELPGTVFDTWYLVP